MTADRRLYSMDLGRRDHTRWLGSNRYAGGGPTPFAYSDIPDQLLRINSLEGSLAFSGAVLTGVTDVSPVAGTVNVTGSPVYTASDAGLNGAPSFTPKASATIVSPNVVVDDMIFVALVFYRPTTGTAYLWRESNGGNVNRSFMSTTTLVAGGVVMTAAGEPAVGRKRLLCGMTGSSSALFNGSIIGTPNAIAATSSGIVWGSTETGTSTCRPAFIMACSSIPSAPLLAALEAKLITDFG